MDTGLDLHIDVQVEIQPKLESIGFLSSAGLLASHLPEGVTEQLACLTRGVGDTSNAAEWLESALLLLLGCLSILQADSNVAELRRT